MVVAAILVFFIIQLTIAILDAAKFTVFLDERIVFFIIRHFVRIRSALLVQELQCFLDERLRFAATRSVLRVYDLGSMFGARGAT